MYMVQNMAVWYGGIVFEDKYMCTSQNEYLLASLEKFEDYITIGYNNDGNVIVFLNDDLD